MTLKQRTTRTTVALCAALFLVLAIAGAGSAGSEADGASSTSDERHSHSYDQANGGLTAKQVRRLARPLARARAATAKYANDLEQAKADGYTVVVTQMIPDMGHHFLNPEISGFDVTKPHVLMYVRNGDDWQLVGFEWVFTEKPARRPLPGAEYGSFPAACHFEDGTFILENQESECPAVGESGAPFSFWHPKLVTLHLWAWYPNPAGIYAPTNRWVRPFNDGQV